MAGRRTRSTKRSGGRSATQPDPTFFVDRNLGKTVPRALLAAGYKVEIHDDHFEQTAKDVEWLQVVGERGWVLLSKDEHIRTNEIEKEALATYKVTAFMLSRQDLTAEAMVRALSAALPRILNLLGSRRRPFVARVTPAGDVTVLTDVLKPLLKARYRS
jgi:hypothetical protein